VGEDIPPPTFDEVKEVIMDIKNNKASGLDNLQAELFKYGGKELKTKMTEIVTKV
jgi:hypothetical protein